eukprot:c20368_g1_i1 orf=371-577(-)
MSSYWSKRLAERDGLRREGSSGLDVVMQDFLPNGEKPVHGDSPIALEQLHILKWIPIGCRRRDDIRRD